MPDTVQDGELITKDPSDVSVYVFDWGTQHLATGVTIASSTFTIDTIAPTGDTALTKDSPSILSGSRKTQIRVSAGTLGASYRLNNAIVTNESPAQTKERSVVIQIEDQ